MVALYMSFLQQHAGLQQKIRLYAFEVYDNKTTDFRYVIFYVANFKEKHVGISNINILVCINSIEKLINME